MKENPFVNAEECVKFILQSFPESRSDNDLLTLLVWQHINPNICSLNVNEVLTHRKQLKLPCMSTIKRCRRKIVEYDESLKGNKGTERARLEMKKQAMDYAFDKVLA